MAVSIRRTSRLRFSTLLSIDDVEFWDIPDFPTLQPQSDDILYQIQAEDRIDIISDKFYGDPTFWWVIAARNNMEILPTDFQTGNIVTIPSPRYVTRDLFANIKRRR